MVQSAKGLQSPIVHRHELALKIGRRKTHEPRNETGRGLTLIEAVEPLYIRDVKPRCGPYVACSITERAAGRTQSAYLIIRPQNLNRLMGERVSEQKA